MQNYGTTTNLPWVPVFTPERCASQLNACCTAFLANEFFSEPSKKKVTLPKVCQLFYRDFINNDGSANGNDTFFSRSGYACLQFCLPFLSNEESVTLAKLLSKTYEDEEERRVKIKYQPSCCSFYSRLKGEYPRLQEGESSSSSSEKQLSTIKISNRKRAAGSTSKKES
jgi:hypothetical protein